MLLLIPQAKENNWYKTFCPGCNSFNSRFAKLLQQLKSGFRGTINWNKYQSDSKTYAQKRYLNHLVNPSLQGVNRLFVLSFENEDNRISHSTNYLPKVEIKNYNVMTDGQNVFDQPINSELKIWKY